MPSLLSSQPQVRLAVVAGPKGHLSEYEITGVFHASSYFNWLNVKGRVCLLGSGQRAVMAWWLAQ